MSQIFFRGFITLLPIALTIYIVYSAVLILENILGSVLRTILPSDLYIPGLGFILTIGLIFFFGLMLNNFLLARVLAYLEVSLRKVPFLRTIYNPLKDLMNLFSKRKDSGFQTVVLVKVMGAQMLGIVTRENFKDLGNMSSGDSVAVYVPFSYALGGFTFLVPKSQVTPVNIPIEKAMSLAITAWVKTDNSEEVK